MPMSPKQPESLIQEPAGAAAAGRRVTILDVARAADVAPSTVSLVTNGTGYVSDEKRRLVEDVVRRVGYRPRGRRKTVARQAEMITSQPLPAEPARGLDVVVLYVPVAGRAGAITATVVPVLDGANAAFAARQIRPSLMAASGHAGDDEVLLSHLRSRRIDGAVLMGLDDTTDHGCVQALRDEGVPMVLVGHRAMEAGISSVNADFRRGSVLSIEHLVGLGHRRVGFVGFAADHWPTAERRRGYEQALRGRGLPLDEPLYMHGLEPGHQHEAMTAYLRGATRRGCTGFLMGDFHANVAVPLLEELGCEVGRDVSVVGFDGLGLKVGRRSLELTSVGYDKPYLGETVVNTLLEVIESGGRLGAVDKTISVSLQVGATTSQVVRPSLD